MQVLGDPEKIDKLLTTCYPYSKEVRKMLAKKTSKNQLTLPKSIAGKFEGFDYFDISVKDNSIILKPVKITPAGDRIESVRDKIEALGLKDEDITEAIRWARRKKSA